MKKLFILFFLLFLGFEASAQITTPPPMDTTQVAYATQAGLKTRASKRYMDSVRNFDTTRRNALLATRVATEIDPTVPAYSKTLSAFSVIKASTDALYNPTIPSGTTAQYYRGDKTFQTLNTAAVPESGNLYFTNARAQAAISAGTGISIASGIVTNTAPDQTVTLTAGNGVLISGTYPNFTIATVQSTISTPTRTLNTNFTVSTTKSAFVFYTLTVSVTNPLLAGTSVGTAFLEYSLNSGTTWLPVTSIGNSSNVGITVTVQLTNLQTGIVGGVIPANALVRLRTTTSGTATITFIGSQEIIY